MQRYLTNGFIFLFSTVYLSACATLPNPHTTPSSTTTVQTLSHFQLRASLGIKTAETGANASLRWQQQGKQYQLQILDPLGMSRATLTGTAEHVVLLREGVRYESPNVESLLKSQLGWTLPISNLIYWVRGLPAPHLAARTQSNPEGQLATLDQQGWHIVYADYVTVDHLRLPRKMTLTQKTLQVRLVVQKWII